MENEDELVVTPKLMAGILADGLQPLRETLWRMEHSLKELAAAPRTPGSYPMRRSDTGNLSKGTGDVMPLPEPIDSSLGSIVSHKSAPPLRPLLQQCLPEESGESMPTIEQTDTQLDPNDTGSMASDRGAGPHPSLRPWLQPCTLPEEQRLTEEKGVPPPSPMPPPVDPDMPEPRCENEAGSDQNQGPPRRQLSTAGSRAETFDSSRRNLDLASIVKGNSAGSPKGNSAFEAFAKKAVSKIRECWSTLGRIKEPARSGCLNDIISSSRFENLCASVILINSIFVAYTSDFDMKYPGKPHGVGVQIIEVFFIVFYFCELVMRLVNHRFHFFTNADLKWNIFDFILVSLSLFDAVMTYFVATDDSGGGNVSFMRIFRLLKLAKILRTLRVMKVFRDLSQILESFKNCMISLFWSLIMMVFVIYVFALIFIQGLTAYVMAGMESGDTEDHAEIEETFGSMISSMLSLYMAVTGGRDWADYYNLVLKAGGFYGVLFIFFMFFFAFALFNILTGVFVEKAVVSAQPEREEVILEQRRKTMEDASEFRHICQVLDTDNTGTISKAEFYDSMQNDLMVSYMSAVGLQVRDVDLFFDLLVATTQQDNEDPMDIKISIDEFVDCCMSMKGMATSFDVQRQKFELSSISRLIKDFEARSSKNMEQITADLKFVEGLISDVRSEHAGGSIKVSTPRVSKTWRAGESL